MQKPKRRPKVTRIYEELGLTRTELARLLCCNLATIYRWEWAHGEAKGGPQGLHAKIIDALAREVSVLDDEQRAEWGARIRDAMKDAGTDVLELLAIVVDTPSRRIIASIMAARSHMPMMGVVRMQREAAAAAAAASAGAAAASRKSPARRKRTRKRR